MDETTRFIGAMIAVEYDNLPMLEKKPGCPDRFVWQEERYVITAKLQDRYNTCRRAKSLPFPFLLFVAQYDHAHRCCSLHT
jgi:hypothetical protein